MHGITVADSWSSSASHGPPQPLSSASGGAPMEQDSQIDYMRRNPARLSWNIVGCLDSLDTGSLARCLGHS